MFNVADGQAQENLNVKPVSMMFKKEGKENVILCDA